VCTAVVVDKHETLWVVVPMTLFFGVIVAMPAAIVLDLITRSARTRPHGRLRSELLHPIRTTRNFFAPIGRMRELVRDARHHNLLHVRYRSEHAVDTADFAHRLRLTIEDAGGMMVKFGQIASTRTDLLPDTMPMTIFTTDGFHLRVREGRILLLWPTPGVPGRPFDTGVDDEWIETVIAKAHRPVPGVHRRAIGPCRLTRAGPKIPPTAPVGAVRALRDR